MARNSINLEFPRVDTIQAVLFALNDTDQIIKKLKCGFTDDNFNETQQLRDNLLIGIASGNIRIFKFRNSCQNLEKHNQCLTFFCNVFLDNRTKLKNLNSILRFH
mmetsp:Transcript_31258/g.31750  ORF Transcript_31258/g.31750 Transcript_31258/m.31750 type:complete len:105 (+) Transcript_31258:68-382(+)